MAVKLSPLFNEQTFDSNGDPLVGGKLYTYVAGSSTALATFTSEAGDTQQANPIILNSRGEPGNPIWLTEGSSYKFALYDADDVLIRTVDNVDGVNDASLTIDQWVASGLTPTYVSATQFTLAGDQTSTFTVNRRLKFTVTAGTVYGYISVSAYTSLTTVTVVLDSGSLDSGLSAVSLGLITPDNTSLFKMQTANYEDLSVTSAKLAASLLNEVRTSKQNLLTNGSLAVNQRYTPSTTDNGFVLDNWRLLLGAANAATAAQNVATDVPTGAGYGLDLTVGSGNNNKFGVITKVELKDTYHLRGGKVSLRVPLKATAGLTDGTGKIRIGILEFTGTGDATTGDPISAWGSEGTDPTLAAGWAYINTPAAISVTTDWADYTVEDVSVGASATNLAVFIWSDDTTNTQTTDVLQIGGYVTLTNTSAAAQPIVLSYKEELERCKRLYHHTFPEGTAPAQNAGLTGALLGTLLVAGTVYLLHDSYPVPMRTTPTVTTYNPSAANDKIRNTTASVDFTSTTGVSRPTGVDISGATNGSVGQSIAVHYSATADI